LEEGGCSYLGRSQGLTAPEKSAEAIVPNGTEPLSQSAAAQVGEGLNVKSFQMLQGGTSRALR